MTHSGAAYLRQKPVSRPSFADVIAAFPSSEVLGTDIGQDGGTIRAWKRRNSIPPAFWNAVVGAADRHGITGVSLEFLTSLAEHRREPAAPSVAA